MLLLTCWVRFRPSSYGLFFSFPFFYFWLRHVLLSCVSPSIFLTKNKRYRYLRHPSYVGWFYWSIGTQLLLGNPFCTIGYAVTGYVFFCHRITYEEEMLQRQYPQQYSAYVMNTYIGFPCLTSPKVVASNVDNKSNKMRSREKSA